MPILKCQYYKLYNMKKQYILLFGTFLILKFYAHPYLVSNDEDMKIKYILQWTKPDKEPFLFMGKGQETFIKRHCPVSNCYVTHNRNLLRDITDFDAILFHGPELYRQFLPLPTNRSQHQKYVFVSMESSAYYPLHHKRFESYFNWTWTYKLNSDEYYGYMIIKNKQGDIIGPREVMHWLKAEEMKPVSQELKDKLKNKTIAAAWFVSNCKSRSRRDKVAKELQKGLAEHNMTLDIYGACGSKKCSRDSMAECLRIMERDYYFYLSFENSFSQDYVTEKLLNPLQYYTVPIVYGGANYTRFVPDGSYLNAGTLKINELVKKMVDIIQNKEKYYDFFRWHNHYSYHSAEETPETDYYCRFCSRINDAKLVNSISVYNDFKSWWHY